MKTLRPMINMLVLSRLYTAVLASQPAPRVVGLSSPEAISDHRFGMILNIRELPDGQLLVNDGQRHQLSILDAKLEHRVVAIDSVFNGSQSYGRNAAAIIPYLSDSTLFVDLESQTFLVLDTKGEITRVMAPANTADMAFLNLHLSGIDSRGNVIYQGTSLSKKEVTQVQKFIIRLAANCALEC